VPKVAARLLIRPAKELGEGQVRALASSKMASAILKLAGADRRLAWMSCRRNTV